VRLDSWLTAAMARRPVITNSQSPKRVCDGGNSGPIQLYHGIVRLVPVHEPARHQKAATVYQALMRPVSQFAIAAHNYQSHPSVSLRPVAWMLVGSLQYQSPARLSLRLVASEWSATSTAGGGKCCDTSRLPAWTSSWKATNQFPCHPLLVAHARYCATLSNA